MKATFTCESCGNGMEHNLSTHQFLKSMDIDQLRYCVDLAKRMIAEKEAEDRVTLWCVGDEWINFGFFREDEYDKAAECFRLETGKILAEGGPIEKLSLDKVKVRQSEVDEYLK